VVCIGGYLCAGRDEGEAVGEVLELAEVPADL